jgi:pimeloyl-ACP methyl ester carboxylesterase
MNIQNQRFEALLELEDCQLRYIQEGKGPDIIWIPPGDVSCDVFDAQFAAFRYDHRCTGFDPRGVGGTISVTPAPWSISQMAADCIALIEHVCTEPVVLTGLSLGALITQEVAFTRPDLVRVAIPMGTGAKKTGFFRQWEEAEISFAEKGNVLPEDFARAHYAALGYPAEVLGDDELWEQCKTYLQGMSHKRDPLMLAAQWRACMEYDSTESLPKCQVPMHVIAFAEDLQTPPARGRQVAELARDGHFHLLKGLAHMSMFGHRPDAVNERIREILKTVN